VLLGGTVLAVAPFFATLALAQVQSSSEARAPVGAPTPARALPSRDSESFEAPGARVGPFKLFPTVEVGALYDDNIFLTDGNKIDDWILGVLPKLALKSDFSGPYTLNFLAKAEALRNVENHREDQDNFGIGFDGSYGFPALGKDSRFSAGADWARLHESRGSVNAANGLDPTEFDQTNAFAGFLYKPNRLGVELKGTMADYNFKDGATSTRAVINNDDRDRIDYVESLRIGYEFVPDYEGYVKGSLNQRSYDQTRDDAGFARSSKGYTAIAGVKLGFSQITSLDVYGGCQNQDYDDARLPNVNGPTFGAQLNLSPAREWNISAYVNRSIEETTQANFSGYVVTTVGAEAKYKLFPAFEIRAGASYSLNDYEKIATAAADREDKMFDASLGAKYYFSRNYYVDGYYKHKLRNSNAANSDYTNNLVFVKLGAQY